MVDKKTVSFLLATIFLSCLMHEVVITVTYWQILVNHCHTFYLQSPKLSEALFGL